MALVKCTCGSTRLEATYVCDPCNDPQGLGAWTEWKTSPVEASLEPGEESLPARQKCPGTNCDQTRPAVKVTCNDCFKTWVPVYPPAAGGLGVPNP